MDNSEQRKNRRHKRRSRPDPAGSGTSGRDKYKMRLFIVDEERNSVIARKNLKKICQEHLGEDYQLEVIDVLKHFDKAIEENILVAPALVIDKPQSARLFGNLQDKAAVLSALELI